MKKRFLKYFIMCTAVIFFMSSAGLASSYDIPVWSSQNNKLNENVAYDDNAPTNSSQTYDDNAPISQNKVNNTEQVNSNNTSVTNETNNVSENVLNTDSVNVNAEAMSGEALDTSEAVTNNPLKLTCGGAILIEQNTGKVIYDYNMHEKLRPASVTKVMTILLIMEALDSGRISLTDKVSCSENASNMGGSQIWLDTTEELTVDEMLKAICLQSANDCSVAMAEYLEGSEQAFVEKMNQRAKELEMNDTTFKNCHGIDEDGHLTSAYDIAIMSRELLKNHPQITNYTTIYMDSLRGGKSELVNTNKLVRNYEGCTGLKTGSTSVALFNLSASATRNGLSLIAVVMRGETSSVRFAEARQLLDYGFNNYQYKELGKANDVVGLANIAKGLESSVEAVLGNDAGVVIKKSNDTNIAQNVEIFNNISAPVTKGQKVGKLTFTLDGNEIAKVDLISNADVPKYSFFTMTKRVFEDWFTLLRST